MIVSRLTTWMVSTKQTNRIESPFTRGKCAVLQCGGAVSPFIIEKGTNENIKFAAGETVFPQMKATIGAVPDYVFEISWEVCNKVGGIHTVLASLAPTLDSCFSGSVVYVGPDLHTPEFIEDKELKKDWMTALRTAGLQARIGRWNIVSQPLAIVVGTSQCMDVKNDVYFRMWENYGVDSLNADGDYDKPSMWAYAAGRVIEAIISECIDKEACVVIQAHEWLSAMGLLHVKSSGVPAATVFTTHATSVGRSICSNGKSLYKYLPLYDGGIMARELNVRSKHSLEKAAAFFADCFTTVSSITDKECRAMFGKAADVILPNGFDNSLVPDKETYKAQRYKARRQILNVAAALTGRRFSEKVLIVSTSGRNDYRPKGFDVYMESLKRLNASGFAGDIIALAEVPCWAAGPREDLLSRLSSKNGNWETPLDNPFITHRLHNFDSDRIVGTIRSLGLDCAAVNGKVCVLLIPTYLDGRDGVFNAGYYELLTACDFTVYPSYYEPWGYTPLESAAFHIPTVTTDLAGFGCWTNELCSETPSLGGGVTVLHRDDDNYFEVAENIKNHILDYISLDARRRQALRRSAAAIAKKAEWRNFVENYFKAFAFAIEKQRKHG